MVTKKCNHGYEGWLYRNINFGPSVCRPALHVGLTAEVLIVDDVVVFF